MNVTRLSLSVTLAVAASWLGLVAQTSPAAAKKDAFPVDATPRPTELVAGNLDMKSTDDETRLLCTGNVVLTGTNLRIACDELLIIATRIGDKDATIGTLENFKYLLATGNVRMYQDQREVTCERAEVKPLEEIVLLTGQPVIIDHSNEVVTTGEWLLLRRGQRQVEGANIRITGPEIKDLGADAKDAPPPASAPQP